MKIFYLNKTCISKLKNILQFLMNNSKWQHVGMNDLIQNVSNSQFSVVEIEVLQFGLKFDTGVNDHNITNSINFNYRHNDSDSYE